MIGRIISGGQTGADRAALDFAITHGIPHGGWCPKGRRAEDGEIAVRYQLQETLTEDYAERTEKNVIDSDGTVIITLAPRLAGGSEKTADYAARHTKPQIHLHSSTPEAASALRGFIEKHRIQILNIAGPRASEEPDVYNLVQKILEEAFVSEH